MKTKLITIYDKVAQETVGPLHPFKGEAPAQRWFQQMLAQPQLQPTMEDLQLVEVGTLDTETLEITPTVPIRILLNGVTVKALQLQEASEQQ